MIRYRDDGDPVKALGFVALNSAYLEDEMARLVEIVQGFAPLHENIQSFRLADQARQVRKTLAKEFAAVPNYADKQMHAWRTHRILRDIETIAAERNEVLHSPLIGGRAVPVLRSRRGPRRLPSRDIYELSERIANAQGLVMELQSTAITLRRAAGK
jgi:hypothetical protein